LYSKRPLTIQVVTKMILVEVSENEKDQYNQFVAAQESGSFLQSWEWGQWQIRLGRTVYRFKIIDDNGTQVASVQLIKMPLPFGKYYLYAPYGPVVSEKLKVESQKLLQEIKNKFSEAVFIRIEPKQIISQSENQSIRKSTNIQPAVTMVLDINKPDDVLLSAMHHKTRYNIRLAQRHGVKIQSELVVTPGYGLYTSEAVNLILQTQVRQNYHGHSRDYYKNLVDFFALGNNTNDLKLWIYKALYNKELLATAVIVDFGPTRMYLYGGSSEKFRNFMAPYLLHWGAIVDAKITGIKYYDFGGSEVASGGERGFTRFKQGFGGRVINYVGAYDIIQNKAVYKAYQLVRKINKIIKKISPQ